MARTPKDILKRYRAPRQIQDTPTSFYTWAETQVMMRAKPSTNQQKRPINYQLIDCPNQVESALLPLQLAPIIAIDTETTGLDPYLNRVRLVQLAIPQHPVILVDLLAINSKHLEPLRSLLCNNALKIGQNLKFDWQMLLMAGLPLSPPFFDTYLAYRVLTAGLKTSLSLDAIAFKLLNIKLDKSPQKSNFAGQLSEDQLLYAATDAAIILPLYHQLKGLLAKTKLTRTANDEFNCIAAIAQMELNGIHLDSNKWKQLGEQLTQQQQQLAIRINQQLKPPKNYQIDLFDQFTTTRINLRSPQQVIAALQDIGIQVESTSASALTTFAQDYPIIKDILTYRSLSTRISTFTKGFINHVHPVTGRIHANWFQIGARSGRFSCRHPNLTNIPRDSATRSCFTPEPGNVLIKADYSQIELRLIAKVSGDKRMSRAYLDGTDLHKLTAAAIFAQTIDEVTDEQRRLGKIINFGLCYGMGLNKFIATTAQKHGIILSKKEASQFRHQYFQLYPGLKRYHELVRKQWQQGIRTSYTLDGRRRVWSKHSQPKLNEMINHPIQGTSATMIKRAIALLYRCLHRLQSDAQLVAVIHDEILLECPQQEAKRVKTVLERCMVKAGQQLLKPIPCEVEASILSSWGGM